MDSLYDGFQYLALHVQACEEAWKNRAIDEWVHLFVHTLDSNPRHWYIEIELHHGTESWYTLTDSLYLNFEYQLEDPLVDDALDLVCLKIVEDPLPISTQLDWKTQVENARECYNFTIDEDENPRNINIPESEGTHVVAGPPLECPKISEKLKIKKVNIRSEASTKLTSIGDYQDDKTIGQVADLLQEYQDLLPTIFEDMKGILGDLGVMRIPLKEGANPVKQCPYRLNPKYKENVWKELDKMLAIGIIEPVEESEWVSPMVVQDKKNNGEIRIYVDLIKLNDASIHDPFPTPFIDEVLDNVGGQEVYSFTDGFLGYHQIKIHDEDRHNTTFAIEWGSFQYTVMPFGLKNAPTIFSRAVVAVFKEFIHKFLEVYFDDWTIFGLMDKHVGALRLMLAKYQEHQISLNLKKCIFCVPFGILLGHVVCRQWLMVDPTKISIIVNLPPPTSVMQLRTTLGHIGYYRKFTKGYTQITTPMEKLLKRNAKYEWTEECQKSLDILKEKMVTTLILVFLDLKRPFHVHVDASSIALEIILAQLGDKGIDHPIAFASRKLSLVERKYTTTKREELAMVYTLQKFRHYFLGSHFKMFIDHSTLKYLVNKPVLGGKICRWLLLFQEYDFEIIVKPGRLNVGPDHLFRIELGEELSSLEDCLLDAQLFSIQIVDDHFQDIIQFLTTKTTPKPYTMKQKKQLVVHIANLTLIAGQFYKLGSNEILCKYVLEHE